MRMGVALMPFIDSERLLAAVRPLEEGLSPEERRREVNRRMERAVADAGLPADWGRGPAPRAEPDQVVRQVENQAML